MQNSMLKILNTVLVFVILIGSICSIEVQTREIETRKKRNDEAESDYFTKITEFEDTPTDEPESPTESDDTNFFIAETKPKRTLKNVADKDVESTTPAVILVPHNSYYALGSDNVICAAAKFDATFIMTARRGDTTGNVSVPISRNSSFDGSCTGSPTLLIYFKMDALDLSLTLVLTFNKTDDSWMLANVELRAPSEDQAHRETHRASSKDLESFKAPLGQSLYCLIPHDIVLEDIHKEDDYFLAYLSINNVRMQAFNVPPEYSPAKLCPPHHIRYHSDEAVFVTAGMLGVLAVGVIIGYGIYRGLKSKKVDYGVM